MKRLLQPSRGFTIVELLIVIVVIGILAGITLVAFNGIRNRADTAARVTEFGQWERLIRLYIAGENRLPITTGVVIDTGANEATYCLGTGYQDTDYRGAGYNTGSCREMYASDVDAFRRGHVEANLNTELAKYGSLPKGPRTCPAGECFLGPYVNFYSTNNMTLANVYPGDTCPSGQTEFYRYPAAPNTRIIACQKDIQL